jgi:hypothetical protein
MPEDDKQEEVKDQEVKTEEKEEEQFLSPGITGPSPGILDKITSIFRGKKETEETEETTETDKEKVDKVENEEEEKSEDDETTEKVEYDEIDPRFISAARDYGWNDSRIIEYAKEHSDQDVLTMVGLFEGIVGKAQPQLDKIEEAVQDELLDEETLSKYAEAFGVDKAVIKGIADKMTGPLAERLNDVSSELESIKGSLGNRTEDEQRKELVRNMDIANAVFDSSDISSLGKTKDIPTYPDGSYVINDPTVQERNKIWDVANTFYATGGTFEHAVENAMQWYKGVSAEKDVKRKVIKDLKEQEERVMPKRQEQQGVETYASEEDRRAALIEAALDKSRNRQE